MSPDDIEEIEFSTALGRTKHLRRDVLLGNGFSVGVHPAFRYDGLWEKAQVSPETAAIFHRLGTTNFELVMRTLLAEATGGSPADTRRAERQIAELRLSLVKALHAVHPARRGAVPSDKFESCLRFLEHFIGKARPTGSRVFTTNYDLLLYWALAPDFGRSGPQKRTMCEDGFLSSPPKVGRANVIYLHGALHLFGNGENIRKLAYSDTGEPLHDQVKALLDNDQFPMVVTEGSSRMKTARTHGYLRDAHTAFKSTCRHERGKIALFTVGHGLGMEDDHLLSLIPTGSVGEVYLGGFGKNEIRKFRPIAADWIAARKKARPDYPLQISLFDTSGVVWDQPASGAGP